MKPMDHGCEGDNSLNSLFGSNKKPSKSPIANMDIDFDQTFPEINNE
jgi:hypothetical protein